MKATNTTQNTKPKAVISLFDYTGNMVKPWADRGYQCFIFDSQHRTGLKPHGRGERIHTVGCDLSDPYDYEFWIDFIADRYDVEFMSAFPPCTDLAVSGAKHFERKAAANPNYRDEAMALVYTSRAIGESLGCPYFIENPISVISSEWRKPNYIFQPYEFGGYLPQDDVNPWFDLIPARDAYPKKTCLWTGGGFELPEKAPVDWEGGYSPMFHKLGGKSIKTKNIRSATPRGFALAVALKYAQPQLMQEVA